MIPVDLIIFLAFEYLLFSEIWGSEILDIFETGLSPKTWIAPSSDTAISLPFEAIRRSMFLSDGYLQTSSGSASLYILITFIPVLSAA